MRISPSTTTPAIEESNTFFHGTVFNNLATISYVDIDKPGRSEESICLLHYEWELLITSSFFLSIFDRFLTWHPSKRRESRAVKLRALHRQIKFIKIIEILLVSEESLYRWANTIIQDSFKRRFVALRVRCCNIDTQIPPRKSGANGTVRVATRSRQRQEGNLIAQSNHITPWKTVDSSSKTL